MAALPNRIFHVCKSHEIQQLRNNGVWINLNANRASHFLNTHFPNLDLLIWITGLRTEIDPIGIKPISTGIELSTYPHPAIVLQIYDKNEDDRDEGLALQRTLMNVQGVISVYHDYFTVPMQHRSKGVAKSIIKISLQQYVNMDIRQILVVASLQNGGYTWAKTGFNATDRSEMESILKKAMLILSDAQFTIVKRFFDNYYNNNPAGDSFPIIKWAELPFMKQVLVGTTWHGSIDFKNQNQLLNFISYVNS